MPTIDESMQLALAHQQGRRLREAEAAYREILARDPRHVDALNNLGSVLQDDGQLEAAIRCFEQALALRPDAAPLYFNLANALRTSGSPQRALPHYHQAVALEPNLAAGHNNLAMAQKDLGDLPAALGALEAAVRVDPNYAQAHYNLGWVRHELGDLPGAVQSYQRSIELCGDTAAAHYNLGLVYQDWRDRPRARRHFLESLRIHPLYAQPHCNLGILHQADGDDDQALAQFERALVIDPQCAEAHYNRGLVLLSRGDYEAGWPEFFWHHRCSTFGDPTFDRPAWDGSPLAGGTLLIHADFGFGDTLNFVRYLPEVRKRGAGRVLLAAQEALHPLLAESGFGEIVSPRAKDLEYDCHVSVMDLPCVFRSNDETIPSEPYLRAAAPVVDRWAEVLARLDGFRVGIAWQGNRKFMWDHLRSFPLAEFEPLARVPGVRLISLQKGDGVEQLPLVAERFEVIELPESEDRKFMDTAAIMASLDLVVAPDTAVAHLAGGLGAPVWLALPLLAEWRWQRGRDTTPWYPSMRLFRQVSGGDWASIFTEMATLLNSMPLARRANH